MIKKNLDVQYKFSLITITRGELRDQRKLLHMLDLTLIFFQHICRDIFTYFEISRNLIVSLTDINVRLASVQTGITCIRIDIDKIYTY